MGSKRRGMVCSAQPEATEAGIDVLAGGGNVVDAAITAALVQCAVDPQMCGIAGFGSMHLYLPDKGFHGFIDFHGRAPLAVTPDMWADRIVGECDDGFGFMLREQVNEVGYQSMTTPLTIKAFDEALTRFGTRPLAQALGPAIDWCEQGFTVRPHVSGFWNQPAMFGRIKRDRVLRDHPATAKIYLKPDGSLYRVGEVLRNPDMGRTMRRIAEHGVDDFYRGAIGREIADDMKRHGGLITMEDLATCSTEAADPLWTTYRGHRVATNQPPGGGLLIVMMLNILQEFDLAALGHNTPDYIAVVAEAMKIATCEKDARLGDPKFVKIPLDELTSREWAKRMAERIRRGEKTSVPRLPDKAAESRYTTHICVADDSGACVSLTHSLGSSSGVVTEGLGFMYNNCMMVFDPRPGRSGSLAPGKARFSAMAPTIVFDGDRPMLVIGAPGGTTITMGILQGILNVVDFGMTAEQAVVAPRICATSDRIEMVNRIPRATERALQARGYPTLRYAESYAFPLVHAIRIRDGRFDGGADPAGDGVALGM